MGKTPKTILAFEIDDKYYSICSFKENKKGELIILPRFAENYSEIEFGNPNNDEIILDQHYTIHHSREENVNVLNHTLCLKNDLKRNTRIYTRAFNKNLFCPLITVRGQDFTRERYRYVRNDIDEYIDMGEYSPKNSTIYYMIIATSAGNKFNGDYDDLNYYNLNFKNYSVIIIWSFGIIPSHWTGNKFHKLTKPDLRSQIEEGYEENEIINQYRLDRQLQHNSFLSFLKKELKISGSDFLLINSLGFKKYPNNNIDKSDKDNIEINLAYQAYTIGNKAVENGKHEEALKLFSESRKIFNKQKNQVAKASLLNLEAISNHTIGKSKIALNVFNQALKIYKQINSNFNIANTYLNISMVHRDIFENEKAKENIHKTIAISEEQNLTSLLSNAYQQLGIIFKNEGNLNQAEGYLHKAIAYYNKEKNKEGKAFCLGNLGLLNLQKGDVKKSLKLHSSSLNIFKEIKHQWGIANETANVGNVICIQGNKNGLSQLKIALEMHQKNGYQFGIATDLKLIGVHHSVYSNYTEGLEYLKKSREVFLKIGNSQEADSVLLLIEKIKSINN